LLSSTPPSPRSLEQLHRDFDALVDHLKDAIGDDLKAHVDPIIGYVDEDLTRAVVAMRAELEHLRAENARLKAPVSDLAKEIVTRIVTDTITLQWIRNIADALSDKVDADDEPTEKTLLADALALALGDDIGCMDEDDEDFRERVCLYWLEDKLAARAHEPQKEINDAE
jgi:hypothetical protein